MNIILKDALSVDYIEQIDITTAKLVNITIEGLSSVKGLTSNYKAVGHYDNETTKDLTKLVNWSIESGNDYAQIDGGIITILPAAISEQQITIKAEYNGINATKSVSVTYDLGIDEFTKSAILASGNSFNDTETLAIDAFFKAIGATDGTGIWTKLNRVYLPILANNINKAVVNYKNNNNDCPDIDSEYWELRSRGLVQKQNTTSTSTSIQISESEQTDIYDFSCFAFNTEAMKQSGSSATKKTFIYSNYMKGGSASDNYYVFLEFGMTGVAGNQQSINITGNSNSVGAESIILSSESFALDDSPSLRGLSVNQTNIKALFSNDIDESSPIIEVNSEKISQNNIDAGPAYILGNISGVVNDHEYKTPMGMIILGTHLDSDEILKLREETKKLYSAIVE